MNTSRKLISVLAISPYPNLAASTRLRMSQHFETLKSRNIHVTLHPMLDDVTFQSLYNTRNLSVTIRGLSQGIVRRFKEVPSYKQYDLLWVQREALIAGPPFFEWLSRVFGKLPMLLDLDDSTWVSYTSPTYGRLSRVIKPQGKTNWLIRNSALVTCGSQYICDYVEKIGTPSKLIPSCVNLDEYHPDPERLGSPPVIGWIGTHSTWPSLKEILPVLERIAIDHEFVLRVIGHGNEAINTSIPHVEVREWSIQQEPQDFSALDIGLYPISQGPWAQGKSALKSVQYMAAGVPFIASNLGEAARIGQVGQTHLLASTPSEWYDSLKALLEDVSLRRRMGQSGRDHAIEYHDSRKIGRTIADIICSLVDNT